MAKKDEFKLFAAKHPEFIKYVRSGKTTWQNLFEIYDIYGEQEDAWSNYLENTSTGKSNDAGFKSFTDKLKNMDFNSIQEHINTAQKALGIVQELTTKGSAAAGAAAATTVEPRPINKIFED